MQIIISPAKKMRVDNDDIGAASLPVFLAKTEELLEMCIRDSNSIILKGVHIGANSVIGAGVIVYKDIPANSVIICLSLIHISGG